MSSSDQKKIEDGEEAKRLLNHPLITEFFNRAEQAVVNSWKTCDPMDVEYQQTLRLTLACQQKLRQQFVQFINDGRIAEEKLRLEIDNV